MRRVGIGEAYIGMIDGQGGPPPNPDLVPLGDAWWGTIEHAVREGGRTGVDIGLFNSPGWSQSGGPWVRPAQAMRYVVLPETRVRGPMRFQEKLARPEGDFQDIAVLAFPAPAGEDSPAGKESRTPTSVTVEFPGAIEARSLVVTPKGVIRVAAELQVSEDGVKYRTARRFPVDRHSLLRQVGPVPLAPVALSLPGVKGRFFRVMFSSPCEVGEVRVSPEAVVERYPEKQLAKVFEDPQPPFEFYSWPRQEEPRGKGFAIPPAAVRNLSESMSADGTLTWDVPARLAGQVEGGMLRSAVTNDGLGGDPAPNHVKRLRVEYAVNGGEAGTATYPENATVSLSAADAIRGPWRLDIAGRHLELDKLASWTERPEPDVRYFSGTAAYRTTFALRDVGGKVTLDLGQVDALAEVTLNGKTFPALWKAPYELDVTGVAKVGGSDLQVRVANVWHNRLVGNVADPARAGAPAPWASAAPQYGANEPLTSSGLVGPATVRGARVEGKR